MSLLGVAVPLNHEHEGLQTTAASRGGLPPGLPQLSCALGLLKCSIMALTWFLLWTSGAGAGGVVPGGVPAKGWEGP